MIAPGATVFVDERPACVIAVAELDEWNPATGEQHQRARIIQFTPPTGRDHVCEPALRDVVLTGDEQSSPPRSRHNDVRTLAAWLGRRRGAADTRQRELVRALVDLERLAS